jgi:glycosyltransferase involved in cell wall biosynthesis
MVVKQASMANRRVLFVTGDFVPVNSNCTFRALGFVEELPGLGWDPFVLTRNPANAGWTHDPGLKADCPIFEVSGSTFLWRLLKKIPLIVPTWLLADRARSWIPFAVLRGVYLVWWFRIDLIFGSFQPWSSLVAAYLISKLTRRPLVSEFRDPIPESFGNTTSTKRLLALVAKIVGHSKGIVTTTVEISTNISMLAGGTIPPYSSVLPHGYRKVDLKPFDVPPINEYFILTFTGSFYRHFSVDTFCRAIAGFLGENPEMTDRLRLKIIGREKDEAFVFLRRSAEEHGIDRCLEILPWQSQKQLQATIAESHIVWFTDVGRFKIIPGKVSKMFACGRPVLALCSPGGATWRAVDETAASGNFNYDDVSGIQGFISRIYQAAIDRDILPNRNEEKLQDYSFRNLTERLVNLFSEATVSAGTTRHTSQATKDGQKV